MRPAESLHPPLGRMTFSKSWKGALSGESVGELLSVGDPRSGTAAYTVLEVFTGTLNGRQGEFAFHQFGTLIDGQPSLSYKIVPASGRGQLAGLTGDLFLNVIEGEHHYEVRYELPEEKKHPM